MIKVTALHVYPLKGAQGFSPASWPTDERGLRHDRRFMLVTDDGRFISQREHPKLALVRATIDRERLRINAGPEDTEFSSVKVKLAPKEGARVSVTIWDDKVEAALVAQDADALLSRFLGVSCRLVWMPDESQRLTSPKRGIQRFLSFADAAPLLIVTEESLTDLNSRLRGAGATDVSMNRFRPNLVVRGGENGEDDCWFKVAVGAARLRLSNSCKRCKVTTIDQATGVVTGPEPLKTLATYRSEGTAVTFGQHALVDEAGTISVGDIVDVLDHSRPRPA